MAEPHGRPEAFGARPVGLARRQQRGRRDPRHARSRAALRAPRLRALLAQRAPRPADDRRQRARDPDGGDRGAHDAHPHRQRRRDAAALQRAEGGRAVPRAGGARAGPHRPRRRPRAGRRHAHRARAEPERAAPRPRPSRSRCATCRPGPRCGATPASPRIRSARMRRRSGSSAAPTTARSSPRTSACRMPSRISSPTGRAPSRRWRSTAQLLPAERAPSASRRPRSASGRSPPTATRRRRTMRCRATAGASTGARRARPAAVARRDRRARLHAGRAGDARGDARRRPSSAPPRGRRAVARARERLELDEIVINTWAHDPAVRRRSYALLAAEFGLAPA